MSPRDAHRLVGISGHSPPQPEAGSSAAGAAPFEPAAEDIVERMRALPAEYVSINDYMAAFAAVPALVAEIDRLRAIISRVRHLTAYTDAEWAMSEIREFLEETP